MKERLYTIGEIFRGKLLRNFKGTAYTDKSTILRIVQKMKFSRVRTQFGMGYAVPKKEIDRHNNRSL